MASLSREHPRGSWSHIGFQGDYFMVSLQSQRRLLRKITSVLGPSREAYVDVHLLRRKDIEHL